MSFVNVTSTEQNSHVAHITIDNQPISKVPQIVYGVTYAYILFHWIIMWYRGYRKNYSFSRLVGCDCGIQTNNGSVHHTWNPLREIQELISCGSWNEYIICKTIKYSFILCVPTTVCEYPCLSSILHLSFIYLFYAAGIILYLTTPDQLVPLKNELIISLICQSVLCSFFFIVDYLSWILAKNLHHQQSTPYDETVVSLTINSDNNGETKKNIVVAQNGTNSKDDHDLVDTISPKVFYEWLILIVLVYVGCYHVSCWLGM